LNSEADEETELARWREYKGLASLTLHATPLATIGTIHGLEVTLLTDEIALLFTGFKNERTTA